MQGGVRSVIYVFIWYFVAECIERKGAGGPCGHIQVDPETSLPNSLEKVRFNSKSGMEYLGLIVNSGNLLFSLPDGEVLALQYMCR